MLKTLWLSATLCVVVFAWPGTAIGQTRPAATMPSTFCNPLSIPDYPIGKPCRDITPNEPAGRKEPLWLTGRKQQFRELADVTVLWHGGRWYMYPSVDMAWVSDDNGRTWQHHPLNVRDIGYAPTVVEHKGKFLLTACYSELFTADSPLGPFKPVGKIGLPLGTTRVIDPMLFSDGDGRLFFYWGNLYGVELDSDHPTRVIGKPVKLVTFEPDKFPWQRCGDWNEDANAGYIEAAWMLKRDGTYYLTYSAAGTEYRTYAVGCVKGKSPLGPFVPQKNNPIQRNTNGLITGTGHGSFVEGPGGSLWAFYTLRAGVIHGWERRLGMDPAWIGDDGELHVAPASSIPMRLTGDAKGAVATDWIPLNQNRQTAATSTAANLTTRLAVDDDLRTWWQPESRDTAPALMSTLVSKATAHAVRIVWRDIGLDARRGIIPGPFRYKVELETEPGVWVSAIDRTSSVDDLLVDYRECAPTRAIAARLVIAGSPPGVTPGVAEFTVFGEVARQ